MREGRPLRYGLYRLRLRARLHRRRDLADPVKTRDRVKTDRRDGASLAKLHRVGELTAVWVPNVGHEAMRDLVRARLDAMYSLRRARQQLSGF
jgi:transposase